MKHRSAAILFAIAGVTIATGYTWTTAQEPRPLPEPVATPANPSGSPARSEMVTTQQYRLKNLAVLDVARKINTFLAESKETLHVEGVVVRGSVVVVPIEVTNSLTVVASGKNHERLSKLIAELDAPPTQVVIRCSLSRVSADGKRDVIFRPQVRTVDGQEASIKISQPDGSFLEFTVTPNTIRPNVEDNGPAHRIER